jgi:hypothetical protein
MDLNSDTQEDPQIRYSPPPNPFVSFHVSFNILWVRFQSVIFSTAITSICIYILIQLGIWFSAWNTFDTLIKLHWGSVSTWNQPFVISSKINLMENIIISSIMGKFLSYLFSSPKGRFKLIFIFLDGPWDENL